MGSKPEGRARVAGAHVALADPARALHRALADHHGVGVHVVVVEHLEGVVAAVALVLELLHHVAHVVQAFAREQALVARELDHVGLAVAVFEEVVGQLHQEDLLDRHLGQPGERLGRVVAVHRHVEGIEVQPDVLAVAALHDVPGLVPAIDVAAPRERLVADADAERGGQRGERAQILGRALRVVDGQRRGGGADQQHVGADQRHLAQLLARHLQAVRPHGVGRAFEIAQRLEVGDLEAAGLDELGRLLDAGRMGDQIARPQLDAGKARGLHALELVPEVATHGDGVEAEAIKMQMRIAMMLKPRCRSGSAGARRFPPPSLPDRSARAGSARRGAGRAPPRRGRSSRGSTASAGSASRSRPAH